MNAFLRKWTETLNSRPDEWALLSCSSGNRLSFTALDAKALAIAQRLRSEVPNPAHSIIAFQVTDRIEWMAVFLATVMVDAIALPIDNTYPPAEVERVLAFYHATLFFDGQSFRKGSARMPNRRFSKDTGLIKLTSGSSSQPKAIPFTHDQMISDADTIVASMGILPDDIHYATIPLGHSYGLGSLVYPLFVHGIPVVFNSMPLPSILARELKETRATVMPTIPAIIRGLSEASDTTIPDSLRLVISAASKLTPEIAHSFHKRSGRRVHNFYGSSETGGIAYDTEGTVDLAAGTIGKPMQGVDLKITSTGRVSVSSAAVFTCGNRHRDAHTGYGIHLMPDRGAIRDGMLTLSGRSNRIAKHNGKRINLEQIERILTGHPLIREAYVIYHEETHRLMAALACDALPDDFAVWMTDRMPPWQRPKYVHVSTSLPHNDRGKPDKARIAHELSTNAKRVSWPQSETP